MELSFEGWPLLFDANDAIQEFAAQYQRMLQADQEQNAALLTGWNAYFDTNTEQLPIPNYPPVPDLRINQLYWPTGATRWGRIYCLADKTTADEIQLIAQDAGENYELKIVFDQEQRFEMWPLPPIPISSVDGSLWLCPLVDARWMWQYYHVGDITDAELDSWTLLFTHLATRLGYTYDEDFTVDTVDSAYLVPHQLEFLRTYENAAVMLEAAAHSVGMRVQLTRDNKVKVTSATTATEGLSTNLDPETTYTHWCRIAGGDLTPNMLPEKMLVTFPKSLCGDLYTKEVTLDTDAGTISGTTKTTHSSCWATAGDPPANQSTLDALATQLTVDWTDWHAKRYDYTFVGVKEWTPLGFDDHTLYDFGGTQAPSTRVSVDDETIEIDKSPLMTTRVVSLPFNFSPQYQLSGQDEFSEQWLKRGDMVIAVTDGGVDAATDDEPGTGFVNIRRIVPDSAGSGGGTGGEDPGEYETVIEDFAVYNDCVTSIETGTRVQIHPDAWCDWFIGPECCKSSE